MENKNLIIGLVIAGLLFIALFQGLQLYNAKNTASLGVQTASVNAPATASSGGGLPQNLQNIPSMVGGC